MFQLNLMYHENLKFQMILKNHLLPNYRIFLRIQNLHKLTQNYQMFLKIQNLHKLIQMFLKMQMFLKNRNSHTLNQMILKYLLNLMYLLNLKFHETH